MIDISIILCVYNGEKYLHNCLNMLAAQDIESKELIIVDDGSTDSSVEILKKFAASNKDWVKLIQHERNYGTPISSLDGMKAAEGQYVGFVDMDDHFETYMFSKMVQTAKKGNYDIVECKHDFLNQTEREKGYYDSLSVLEETMKQYYNNMEKVMFGEDIFRCVVQKFVPEMLFLRIYKRSIIKKVYYKTAGNSDIMRVLRYTIYEDTFLTPLLFMEAQSYFMLDCVLYHYRFMAPTGHLAKEKTSYQKFKLHKKLIEIGVGIKSYYTDKCKRGFSKETMHLINAYIGSRIISFLHACPKYQDRLSKEYLLGISGKEMLESVVFYEIKREKNLKILSRILWELGTTMKCAVKRNYNSMTHKIDRI